MFSLEFFAISLTAVVLNPNSIQTTKNDSIDKFTLKIPKLWIDSFVTIIGTIINPNPEFNKFISVIENIFLYIFLIINLNFNS